MNSPLNTPLRAWAIDLKTVHPESHATVKKAISQGNLVVLYSNFILEPGSKGTALVDIFRIHPRGEGAPGEATDLRGGPEAFPRHRFRGH